MIKTICDRCGDVVDNEGASVHYNSQEYTENLDFCRKCKWEVWNYLTKK